MRTLPIYGILLLIFVLVMVSQAGAQSTYLSAVPIPSTLAATQIWMRESFCVRGWWYDNHGQLVRLCSEDKGADTPSHGASHKVDLPGPAALALIGKGERWELSAIALAKPDSQLPGENFVRVTGPTLVTILSQVTPPPVSPPPATVTAPPTGGATATPTAQPTPTPPSPPVGNIPTLSPAQRQAFSVYCDRSGRGYGMTIWGSYGLTYNVPDEWCAGARNGVQDTLRRMAEATLAWVEVKP